MKLFINLKSACFGNISLNFLKKKIINKETSFVLIGLLTIICILAIEIAACLLKAGVLELWHCFFAMFLL